MTTTFMKYLWEMHDNTKSLFCFTFRAASRYLQKVHDASPEKSVSHHAHENLSSPQSDNEEIPRPYNQRQKMGLILGPLLFLLILWMPINGMLPEAQKMAAIVALMATWWIGESTPIPVTSLLPIILFPLMGIMPVSEATAPYANQLIFLFMGGFMIALSMQRWHLHKRIAMYVIRVVGFSPSRLILGFMIATALLSAFISNTATTLMMMPIGFAVIMHVLEKARIARIGGEGLSQAHSAFGVNLMLGIAYAASIGGIATIIGTPPNMVLVGYVYNTYGLEITFAQWLKIGVPFVVVFLPLCWLWLTRVANPMNLKKLPGGKELIHDELEKMGKMNVGEKWTALIFALTTLGWIFRQQLAFLFPDPAMVTDASIAMLGAVLLFVIPVSFKRNEFVMNWKWAVKLPWGVLILFGGGLSLALGFEETGLADWMGEQIQFLEYAPMLLIIISAITLIIFLTELTSNVATTAMILPIFSAVAIGIGESPLLLLIPAAIAASCAFMLPVATPPNAIVFGSGYVTMPSMVKSGFGLNIIGIMLITALTYFLVMRVFGIEFGVAPIDYFLD